MFFKYVFFLILSRIHYFELCMMVRNLDKVKISDMLFSSSK